MKGGLLISVLALAAVSYSRPPSREYFTIREKAEYGDTYSFLLDFSDSTATYSLDFFTRLERSSFGDFPDGRLVLDLRWFSPSDTILVDTAFVNITAPVQSAYYSRDYISPYEGLLPVPGDGEWRLKAKVVNDSEAVRGLSIVFRKD